MRELSEAEVAEVSGGGRISGYEGAGAIIATVGLGSLFTPIGPITGVIAVGSAGGLAIAQLWADLR